MNEKIRVAESLKAGWYLIKVTTRLLQLSEAAYILTPHPNADHFPLRSSPDFFFFPLLISSPPPFTMLCTHHLSQMSLLSHLFLFIFFILCPSSLFFSPTHPTVFYFEVHFKKAIEVTCDHYTQTCSLERSPSHLVSPSFVLSRQNSFFPFSNHDCVYLCVTKGTRFIRILMALQQTSQPACHCFINRHSD